MKITNISCTQFAGVRDRNISLTDGINVICGKNESGKSTLVNLLSRTLFQNARLDKRTDKEFLDLYFPGAKRGSKMKGDFADGRLTFETPNGTYTLTKEWGAEARCTLSTPDGVIRDQSTIDKILKQELLYGEGVYSDMLLSSQRNTDLSLQTILDAAKKTEAKQEIADAVSQAFAESDGVSVDVIEQAIQEKIDEIMGKHWDVDRDAPVRKSGRWATGLGEILKAYYAVEDARDVLDEISCLEREADSAANDYTSQDIAAAKAEEAYNKFNTFASLLAVQSERRKTVERSEKELSKITEVLENWPKWEQNVAKAKKLQEEKSARAILDLHGAAKKVNDEMTALRAAAVGGACPDAKEISAAKDALRSISFWENKLCGMNLTAAVQMFGENRVEVTSLRTGEAVDISAGVAAISEAVKITVPGVMELQLSPADVDVAAIEARLTEGRKTLADIFGKYEVSSVEKLEELAKTAAESKAKLEHAAARLEMLLGAQTFEEVEAKAAAITEPVRTAKEIEQDIYDLCGSKDAAAFVTKNETVIGSYAADYGTVNELKVRAFDLENELKKARQSLSGAADIPAEYLRISDPEGHLELLQSELKMAQKRRELALTAKTAAASKLESYRENTVGDPAAEADKAERIFAETKSLLDHWLHIAEVFRAQKESLQGNPMQDIADAFSRYLSVISGGRVESEFPEADRLNMNIYSDNRLLDYGKLSEGTKETVSLAFRLAVLDHLFPDGGGVIVFDDPFTDMDAERTAQSCELMKACAQRHQVIFLTCKEDYSAMLGGNQIRI